MFPPERRVVSMISTTWIAIVAAMGCGLAGCEQLPPPPAMDPQASTPAPQPVPVAPQPVVTPEPPPMPPPQVDAAAIIAEFQKTPSSELRDQHLEALGSLTEGLDAIEDLNLMGAALVTEKGFSVTQKLPNLKKLNVTLAPAGNETLKLFGELKLLEELRLSGCSISDAGIMHLTGLENIKLLDVSNTQVTDAGLEVLAHMPHLETLIISRCAIDGRGFAHLVKPPHPEFKHLIANHTRVVDDAINIYLKQIKGLETLNVFQTAVTDRGMVGVKTMLKLKQLEVGFNAISDSGAINFVPLKQLEFLNMHQCGKVTDASVSRFVSLKQLKYLNIIGCQVGDLTVNKLKKAIPEVKIDTGR